MKLDNFVLFFLHSKNNLSLFTLKIAKQNLKTFVSPCVDICHR